MIRYRRWPSYQAWRITRDAKYDIGLPGHLARQVQAKARALRSEAMRVNYERHYYADSDVRQMFGPDVLQELQRLRGRLP